MKRTLAAVLLLSLSPFAGFSTAQASNEPVTVGRITMQRTNIEQDEAYSRMEQILNTRYAPESDSVFPRVRVLALFETVPGQTDAYVATIFDYESGQAFELQLDAEGRERSRAAVEVNEFQTNRQEINDALRFVREYSEFAQQIADGKLVAHEAMPPVSFDVNGERVLNIIVSDPLTEAIIDPEMYEVFGVSFRDLALRRYEGGAPSKCIAKSPRGGACGTAAQEACSSQSESGVQTYAVSWPTLNPVWQFDVRRPEDTRGITTWGTGIDITNVRYRGRLVLAQAHVPSFSVKYDNNACGPFRDWLYSEDCFTVTEGTSPVAGFHINADTRGVATICQSGRDTGNFNGVAITDEGTSLWLVTETDAGWYRYIMEWRFHLDGTLEPIFTFGDVPSGCTCNPHNHHINWRFEFALDGVVGDDATGITTAERSADAGKTWVPITVEEAFDREERGAENHWVRFTNPTTGMQATVQSGPGDRSSTGDSFTPADFYVLTKTINGTSNNEVRDGNGSVANIIQWVNAEAIGATERSVLWYHASQRDVPIPGLGANDCGQIGPRIVFSIPDVTEPISGQSFTVYPMVPTEKNP